MDAHDGCNCDWIGLYIDWHCCRNNRNQLGLCINEYIVKLVAINSDCVSMSVDGGFDGGFDGQFHLSVLGYRPQQSVRQLSQEAFTAIN